MISGALPSLLLANCLPALAFAKTVVHGENFWPDHVLRVSIAEVPSGCESRENVVVNGTSPGPTIRLLAGVSSWIRVYNDMMDQNLTMHWHGLSQRLAPFADGTPALTQWPIPPGHFFDYEVATQLEDAGTYFYHSHVDMQALSCTGALVLDDCGSSPYDYDDERILLFQDYFQHKGREMIQGLTSVPFSWAGETHGIMLNGRGVASGHISIQGFPGEANGFFGSRRFSTEGGINGAVEDDQIKPPSDCTLPVIDVEPGKTYRLRFIGATGLSFLAMGFEDHSNLTIVQVDGSEYNAPVDVDYLQLGAGQRFDVVLQTKTAEELAESGDKTTFYLQFETRDRPDPYRGYGVLRYSLDTPVPPPPSDPVLSLPTDTANWLEFTLQPLDPSCNQAPTASDVTRRVILDAVQKLDPETGRLVWELAHLSLTESTSAHPTPVLIEIYRHGQAAIPNYTAALANHGWDPATKLFPAKTDEVLEIVIQNTGSEWAGAAGLVESHPFHAHGQHYYDVGSGPGKYDAEANDAKLERLGYRPVKRDTTMLFRYGDGRAAPGEPAGWRAWRLRTDHPGVWMVHCHISAHVVMGMGTIWVVGDADEIATIPLSVSESYYTYGGSVYGNETHAPAVYHYFDHETDECVAAGGDGGDDVEGDDDTGEAGRRHRTGLPR